MAKILIFRYLQLIAIIFTLQGCYAIDKISISTKTYTLESVAKDGSRRHGINDGAGVFWLGPEINIQYELFN